MDARLACAPKIKYHVSTTRSLQVIPSWYCWLMELLLQCLLVLKSNIKKTWLYALSGQLRLPFCCLGLYNNPELLTSPLELAVQEKL